MEIIESNLSVPAGSLYAKCWIPEQLTGKPPVILLHDSLGCTDMWRDFPVALANHLMRHVISYDRLGYGRSSARGELPSARFVTEEAESILPLVKAHFSLSQYVLFGHSVGGGMAVTAAGLATDDCVAVISEAAQAYVETRTVEAIRQAKVKFAAPEELRKLQKYHGAKTRWVVDAWTDTWLSLAFANWTLRDVLPRVRCPLLAIHGDRDDYGSEAFPEMISSMAAGYAEKLVISDCGHIPHRERASIVLQAVTTFLSRF